MKYLANYYDYAHRYLLTYHLDSLMGRPCIRLDYTLVQKIMTFFQSPKLLNLANYYDYAHRYLLTYHLDSLMGRPCIRLDYTLVQKIMTFFQSPKLLKQKTSLLVDEV